LKSSDNLWGTTKGNGSDVIPRRTFALTGRSTPIDPRHNAVRGDLADIRLAEQVFAPHYAAPMACRVTRAVALLAASSRDSEILAELAVDDRFEVLEVLRDVAWGLAPDRALAGYVDRGALERA
jgi:hypothetical protein